MNTEKYRRIIDIATAKMRMNLSLAVVPLELKEGAKLLLDWQSLILPPHKLPVSNTRFNLSVSSDLSHWRWSLSQDASTLLPRLLRIFQMLGVNEYELSILKKLDVKEIIGWYEITTEGSQAGWEIKDYKTWDEIQALIPTYPDLSRLKEWAEPRGILGCSGFGRAPGTQTITELKVQIPGEDPNARIREAMGLYSHLGVEYPPALALAALAQHFDSPIFVNIWMAEAGIYRLGIQAIDPSDTTVISLIDSTGHEYSEKLAMLSASMGCTAASEEIEVGIGANGYELRLGYWAQGV